MRLVSRSSFDPTQLPTQIQSNGIELWGPDDDRWQASLEEFGSFELNGRLQTNGCGSGAPHIFIEELGGHAIESLMRYYSAFGDRECRTFSSIDEFQRWIQYSNTSYRSITLWADSVRLSFEVIERFEAVIHDVYEESASLPPVIGYFAAEDTWQLFWLTFKTLLFQLSDFSAPDGVLIADDGIPKAVPTNKFVNSISPTELSNLTDPMDGLFILAHGRSFDTHILKSPANAVTLCSLPGSTFPSPEVDELGPRCRMEEYCFRDGDVIKHRRLSIGSLRSRMLMLNSCASWRFSSDVSVGGAIAIRALDGWCTGLLGSRYEKEGLTRDNYLALGAWRAGKSLGQIQQLLSPGRLQLYSLIGDPEQTANGLKTDGYESVKKEATGYKISGLRNGVFYIPLAETEIGPKKYFAYDQNGCHVGFVDRLSPSCSIYVVDRPEVLNSSELSIRVDSETAQDNSNESLPRLGLSGNSVSRHRLEDRWRMMIVLFGFSPEKWPAPIPMWHAGNDSQTTKKLVDLGRAVQALYGRNGLYWPGPVQEDDIEWLTKHPPILSGRCFGCDLPTMLRKVWICETQSPNSFLPSLELVREETYCPHCYQITHLPQNVSLAFSVERCLNVGEPFMMRVDALPGTRGVAWPAVFQLEESFNKRFTATVQEPRVGAEIGDSWSYASGFPAPGSYFVRLYFVPIGSLEVHAVSTLVRVR